MKDLYKSFQAILSEIIWFLILQGIFLLVFTVLILFFPYALVILVALLLICLAVVSLYFGYKVMKVKMAISKLKKEIVG